VAEGRILLVKTSDLYLLASPPGRLKLGVAADPRRRLRNLQVGSPVPLELAAGDRSNGRGGRGGACRSAFGSGVSGIPDPKSTSPARLRRVAQA